MGLWAVCKTHGHGIDGTVEEIRVKAGPGGRMSKQENHD